MIELLVGPIASGKSTYCREASKNGAIIVNDDSIVTALHGDYLLYDKKLKPLYKIVENTIVGTALSMNRRVVIDRPNYSRKTRRRYIGLAHSLDVSVELVVFKRENPLIHAERRYNSDSRGYDLDYWLNVAKTHDKLFEEPVQEIEQFDSIREWIFPLQKKD